MISNPALVMSLASIIAIILSFIAIARLFRYRQSMNAGVAIMITGLVFWTVALTLGLITEIVGGVTAAVAITGVIAVSFGLAVSQNSRRPAASRIDDFVSLIDHLAEPCLLIHDQRIVAVNQPMEDLIYRSREELLGKNPYDLWDALEFNIPPAGEILEHVRGEGSWHFITKIKRHDGAIGHGEVRISLLDEDEERQLIILFVADITARVESDRRLRENEMRLSTSQAIAGLGYWHYHMNEGAIEWSDQLLRIMGLDDPDSRERYPTDESRWKLIHPGDVDILRSRLESAIRTGVVPPETSFRIIRPDDELRHARVRFGIVRGTDDGIEELFGVVQDVTDLVGAEQRLRHAQRMEAIGSLTGGISHDFNNLLQVIMGNAELLEGRVDPASEESLKTIRHAAQRGSELTQLLLAYSRRQHLEPKTINVNDYVSGMLPLLKRTLGETITIESDQSPDLHSCQVDPGQLENCILNLAINAHHAMPDGGTLTIETRNVRLDEDYASQYDEVVSGDYVQLTITDTGTGMSEPVQSRAFEPFFTTKEVGKGSGLGLSMVFGFIKQSAGHVELDSEPGRGTSVKLFLPVAVNQEAIEPSSSQDTGLAPFTGNVLLVEDDPQVAVLTRKFLISLGMNVITANSLSEVRDKLDDAPPLDLLLTDVVLPGASNGPAIAEEVKGLYPDVRVLFMSGYTDNSISMQGDTRLLTKPFTRSDLAGKLREVFETG